MDPFLNLLVVLSKIAIVAFVIERSLEFIFEIKYIREWLYQNNENIGNPFLKPVHALIKPAIALICGLTAAFALHLDILFWISCIGSAGQLANNCSEGAHYTPWGQVVTGIFLAGGSAAAMTLVQQVMGLGQAVRRRRAQLIEDRLTRPNVQDRPSTQITGQAPNLALGGQRRANVLNLQGKLANLGFLDKSQISGEFCQATKQAVLSFQKRNKLTEDGQVGYYTRSVLNTDRCGVPDFVDPLSAREIPENGTHIRVGILNAPTGVDFEKTKRTCEDACKAWEKACNIIFEFQLEGQLEYVDIAIEWKIPDPGSLLSTDHTVAIWQRSGIQPHPIYQGKIELDSGHKWLLRDVSEASDGKSIYVFVLHELGHAIGITDHTTEQEDIMFWAPSRHRAIELSEKDIELARGLYGSPNLEGQEG